MKSFTQFVTEYAGIKSAESGDEMIRAVRSHLDKGKKISSFDGEPEERLTYRTTTSADGLERKEKIKNSVSATINQGVAGGGY